MIIDVTDPGTCQSCKARIYWRREKSGKLNPYNPPMTCPACDGRGHTVIVTLFQDIKEPCTKCDSKGRVQFSHFSSCPNAKEFRKAKV